MLKFLIALVLFVYFTFLFLIVYGSRYRNPYRLYMVFGKKGSGKTTLITKLSLKHIKKGWKVYSTVPVPGTYLFDAQDIGKITFDQNSVLFLDEGGILFDNRNFKNFRNDTRDWFKYQRHYRVKVYIFSQAFDIDVKLRNLTDYMYLTTNFFNVISIARRVQRSIIIVHPSGEAESRIADDLNFTPWLLAPFGGLYITWIPKYIKYFDSFAAPELSAGEFSYCEYPEDFSERFLSFKIQNYLYQKLELALSAICDAYFWIRCKVYPFCDEDGKPITLSAKGDGVQPDDGRNPDAVGIHAKRLQAFQKLTTPNFLKPAIEKNKKYEELQQANVPQTTKGENENE